MSTREHGYNEIRYNPQFLTPCAQSTSTPSDSCNNRLLLTDLSNFCQTIDCCRVNSYLSEIVNPILIEPSRKSLIQLLKGEKNDQCDYQQQNEETSSGTNEEVEPNDYSNNPTLDDRKPMTCAFYYSNPETEATWISVESSNHHVTDLEPKIEPDDWPSIPADLTTTSMPITQVNSFNDGYSTVEVVASSELFDCKFNQTSTSPISSSTDISCYNNASSASINHPNLLVANNPVSFRYHEDLNDLHSKQNRFPFTFLNGSYRYHNAVGRIRGGNLLSKEEQRVNACRRERVRMKAMNLAFDALRACINPSLKPRGRKFSKIETLRAAIVYISDLNEILNSDCNADSSGQIFMSTSSGFYGWPRNGSGSINSRGQQAIEQFHYHLNHSHNESSFTGVNNESKITSCEAVNELSG